MASEQSKQPENRCNDSKKKILGTGSSAVFLAVDDGFGGFIPFSVVWGVRPDVPGPALFVRRRFGDK
jgi:hypothetical protein